MAAGQGGLGGGAAGLLGYGSVRGEGMGGSTFTTWNGSLWKYRSNRITS